MIRMVTTVEVAHGHEDEWEDAWRTLREARRQYPGFQGASILRDSSQPTHYLVLSEWDGHDQLAAAMRGLSWLNRDLTTPWTAGPTRVYDEVVDNVGEITDAGGTRNPM
jgi:antibiotic biosynthesis monooxygenase (ABM) superfamily enzyme